MKRRRKERKGKVQKSISHLREGKKVNYPKGIMKVMLKIMNNYHKNKKKSIKIVNFLHKR